MQTGRQSFRRGTQLSRSLSRKELDQQTSVLHSPVLINLLKQTNHLKRRACDPGTCRFGRVLNRHLLDSAGRRSLITVMRVFRQFGVLVLLLVSCLAPAMACMVSSTEMNTEERSCCRMMKTQCGQMGMPASHGCCQKTPPSVHDNAMSTKVVTLHPVVVPVLWLAALELVSPNFAVTGWVEHPDYSPPKAPPSTISILRI